MKKLVLAALCFLFALPVFAQIQPQGFSVGLHTSGMFPLGDYSHYSTANVGGGADLEYSFTEDQQPFGEKIHIGLFFTVGYSHSFIKEDTPLSSLNDMLIDAGLSLRISTVDKEKFKMALVPEMGCGFVFHFPKSEDGSELDAVYMNPLILLTPSVRFILPKNLEVMVNPIYTIAFEKSAVQQELGLQLGIVWHISDFLDGRN